MTTLDEEQIETNTNEPEYCGHEWSDNIADDHVCDLAKGHDGDHECGICKEENI